MNSRSKLNNRAEMTITAASGAEGGVMSFDNPKYDAAFDRCMDIITRLILKYGAKSQDSENDDKTITA